MSKLDLDYFEHIICYKTLTDSSYLATIIDHVKPAYFKNKDIAKVFTIISAFYQKRNKLPTVTEVKSYLTTDDLKNSFRNIVNNIKDVDKNLDRDELYENTETFLKEKAVYHTMLSIAEDIASNKVDTSAALAKFEKSCNINLVTDKGISLLDDVDKIIEDLNSTQNTIPSKWPWLDEHLNGGFLENGRALYVFVGETNIGKSIFLGNIATNIASQGKNVLLISLEMSELLYAKRLCSSISKIPLKELSANAYMLKDVMKESKQSNHGSIFIKEFPPSTITANHLKAFVKKITDTSVQIDAIVIDYLNLLHTTVGNNSYERIKHITEQVRALSYMFNCPIISASQLNRAGFNTENPDMTTISESIGLAATADVIVSIYQNEEDRELNVIRLGLMKNRYGMRGVTQPMRIDYNTLTVSQTEDIADSEQDETFKVLQSLEKW